MDLITDDDIARARRDPRLKQILLAKALEQLLATLYRMQRDPARCDPEILRQGATMAAKVADVIRELDEQAQLAESA
ncbi:MAG TPA: hypothetical protein VNM46_15585 [Xanthobacteraceae bacterium]|jgi:hypothetical protein|nr:hypothetical protein [Xanthobacteraceae bacterium]